MVEIRGISSSALEKPHFVSHNQPWRLEQPRVATHQKPPDVFAGRFVGDSPEQLIICWQLLGATWKDHHQDHKEHQAAYRDAAQGDTTDLAKRSKALQNPLFLDCSKDEPLRTSTFMSFHRLAAFFHRHDLVIPVIQIGWEEAKTTLLNDFLWSVPAKSWPPRELSLTGHS